MKFKITYKVFSIPCDAGSDGTRIFSSTYKAESSDLEDLSSQVNEYLQRYFAVGNYELLGFERMGK